MSVVDGSRDSLVYFIVGFSGGVIEWVIFVRMGECVGRGEREILSFLKDLKDKY